MTGRPIPQHERLRDTMCAAYELARVDLCIETVRETVRIAKPETPRLALAIRRMAGEHLMPIDRIAWALNRDRKTVRHHIQAVDKPVEKLSPSFSFQDSSQTYLAGA